MSSRPLFLLACLTAFAAADAGRERPLDEGWRFLRGDAVGAELPDFDDQAWRRIDLPHDWSIEDLPPRDQDTLFAVVDLVPGSWRFRSGDDATWSQAAYDDSSWRPVELPEPWDRHGQTGGGQAVGWYRRSFTVPALASGRTLHLALGVIHDESVVWVDGLRLGDAGTGYWSNNWCTTRVYTLTGVLATPGGHVVAVRVKGGTGHENGCVAASMPPIGGGPCDPGRSAGGLSTGYAVGGTGWYRRRFTLSAGDAGKLVRLVFDGSYMITTVWCNGAEVGGNAYGYSPFGLDLTPHLRPTGQENVLAVRVGNQGRNSRWYSGSGIIRPVRLELTEALRIAPWGIAITTPEMDPARTTVQVRVELANAGEPCTATVRVTLSDAAGAVAGRGETRSTVGATGATSSLQAAISAPRFWSPDRPALYRAEVEVLVGERVADRTFTSFGIRTLAWNAEHGLSLNGEPIVLKGGCIHHDHGPLGAAAFPRAEERRAEILKAAGYNAIRTSHNHPSSSLLDACDRLGLLVVDEAFDMWRQGKNDDDYHHGFAACWEKDLDALVKRDRNHPAVAMWSIGNEIPERYEATGAATARALADHVRALDASRPVTAAFNGVNDKADGFLAALDIAGYNYNPERYVPDHRRLPRRVMLATESYPRDSFRCWEQVRQHPWVVGDFVWTAWDYRGESGIGHTCRDGEANAYLRPWPWHNAFCGDFDACGQVKPQGLYRQVLWGARACALVVDEPQAAPSTPDYWGWRDEWPSWTWRGHEGRTLTVRVYARGDQVRLLLNGSEQAAQAVGKDLVTTFSLAYQPGTLTAQVLQAGHVVAEDHLITAHHCLGFTLTADQPSITAARDHIVFITVSAIDDQGHPVPDASQPITATVTGHGTLAACGNGDPTDVSSVQDGHTTLWHGRALVVLRSDGTAGDITCRVRANGCTDAQCLIPVH